MENKTLSVIVPVYNTKEYLPRCLDSIINQTYTDLEIICVDDGSTDGSDKILDDYAQKDDRIHVFRKEHHGVVSSRKTAISNATGHYVTYVDSDDYVEIDMYQRMMEKMIMYNVDIVATGFIRDYGSHSVEDNEKIAGYYFGSTMNTEIKQKLVDIKHPFRFAISPSQCNKIFKTSILKEIQMDIPDSLSMDEDTACSYMYIMKVDSAFVMDKSFYHYCQRMNSRSNDMSISSADQLVAVNLTYDYLHNKIEDNVWEYLRMYALLNVCPGYALSYENHRLFPFEGIICGKRIVLYGNGGFGRRLHYWIQENTNLEIVALGDKNGDGCSVLRPDQIKDLDYDYLLICVLLADVSNSIRSELIRIGIPSDKIKCISI